MISHSPAVNRFYRSAAWQQARLIKITSANGRCERCGGIGEEVHHRIHITPVNVNDSEISLDQDNLVLLCKECHNKEHERFKSSGQKFDGDGQITPF